jgi:DNA-binding transcriptional ArsR family regulator
MTGDADLSRVGALIGDRARSRILLALASGRELSAGLLAAEAGISRSTASAHLKRLTDGGLIDVRIDGKARHYRLAGPRVADLLERAIELSPPERVTSLRSSTRATQLRRARTCYDHIAGKLGVGLMHGLLERGYLTGGDGAFDRRTAAQDRPAGPGRDVDYRLTESGQSFLDRLGVLLPGGRRPLIRYCVDWTETKHHLAGRLGRGLRNRCLAAGWVENGTAPRALRVTPAGAAVFDTEFGVVLDRA